MHHGRAGVLDVVEAGRLGDRPPSAERMPSWSQRAPAPIATASRATSAQSSGRRNTSTRSTGSSRSASDGAAPSQVGLTGSTR